jgi:hypothetical protein
LWNSKLEAGGLADRRYGVKSRGILLHGPLSELDGAMSSICKSATYKEK